MKNRELLKQLVEKSPYENQIIVEESFVPGGGVLRTNYH